MDPVRNPYAPGAGQRPPELTGARPGDQPVRSGPRAGRPRPARSGSMVLTGACAGVGKTVLLNTFQVDGPAAAVGHRQDRGAAGPVDQAAGRGRAAHGRARARAPAPGPGPGRLFPRRPEGGSPPRDPQGAEGLIRHHPPRFGIDVPMQRGPGPIPATLEVDLTELFAEAASVAGDPRASGSPLFVDEMQDIPTADVSALCAACHELSQTGGPADRGSARACRTCRPCSRPARATPSGCFRYARIDRLDPRRPPTSR